MVLGLIGLGNSWCTAHELWGLTSIVGEIVMVAGGVALAILILLLTAKWLPAKEEALADPAPRPGRSEPTQARPMAAAKPTSTTNLASSRRMVACNVR